MAVIFWKVEDSISITDLGTLEKLNSKPKNDENWEGIQYASQNPYLAQELMAFWL